MEEQNDDEEKPGVLFCFVLNIGELTKAQVSDQNTM